MKKKIIISAGGTGGHLFPAIALAQQLDQADLLFIGGGLSTNRYFNQDAFAFEEVSCGSFVSKKPWHLISSACRITQGIAQSYLLLRRHRPDLVVGFGSFYGFPPLVAATALGIPTILYAADVIPGKVLRLMSSLATVTGLHFASTASRLRGRSAVVGMPLRQELRQDQREPAAARQHYGLSEETTTLLIFGGSQGALALNTLIEQAIPSLVNQMDMPFQVIHLTGNEGIVTPLREAYRHHGIQCHVVPFEQRMGIAWSAADLALCRSGAGTVAEIQAFGVPAILVPYPYSADAHQEYNADAMEMQGGAQKLLQSSLTPEILSATLVRLLGDRDGSRARMKVALQQQGMDSPSLTLADLVWQTLNCAKSHE